ncbi:hypothetical protein B0J13DRAFT_613513 [Dactylonectria estremocensis]|uniref:Uncharacterized protein n=1 Tax=Dactylonectria estremocensis TaxID=1079267 RepID=A0A9P9IC89_9HYPO|nr:hypothetical protein B0J13DRAFT_613513 [Dactylonectria estremocensis]
MSNRNFHRSIGGACDLAISAAVLQARLRATLPPEYQFLGGSTYTLPDAKGGTSMSVWNSLWRLGVRPSLCKYHIFGDVAGERLYLSRQPSTKMGQQYKIEERVVLKC